MSTNPEPFPTNDPTAKGLLSDTGPAPDAAAQNVHAMMNVALTVQIVLGQTRMPISQLLDISRGSVIELDKRIGAPVDMMINDRLVARGDLVKVGDNRVGVTLTEIIKDLADI